jgi:hypothetical protein
MSRHARWWPIFAVVGWALAVVGAIGGLLARIVWPAPILPSVFGGGPIALVAVGALGITWSTVGAVLVIRRPDNPVGRIMIVVGAGFAMSVLTMAVAFAGVAEGTAAGRDVASVAGALTAFMTPIVMLVFYLPFIFPTGRGHTPRWDAVGRISLGIGLVLGALLVFQPGDVHLIPGIHNPIGFGPDLRAVFGERFVARAGVVLIPLFGPFMILSVASRYRVAGVIERQQLRWFILASAVTAGSSLIMSLVAAVTAGPPGETPLIVFGVAGTTVPIAIGIAILRYHLFEIDRIISRTISYGLVTLVLFGIFAAVNLALVSNVSPLVNNEGIAVAVSTLLVAALFNPVRGRVQRAVDRRFHRARFNADRMVSDFATRLRDEIEIDRLRHDFLEVIDRSVEPAHADLWLRPRTAR